MWGIENPPPTHAISCSRAARRIKPRLRHQLGSVTLTFGSVSFPRLVSLEAALINDCHKVLSRAYFQEAPCSSQRWLADMFQAEGQLQFKWTGARGSLGAAASEGAAPAHPGPRQAQHFQGLPQNPSSWEFHLKGCMRLLSLVFKKCPLTVSTLHATGGFPPRPLEPPGDRSPLRGLHADMPGHGVQALETALCFLTF